MILVLEAFFVVSVILIWFMIAYQFILTVYGYINFVQDVYKRQQSGNLYALCSRRRCFLLFSFVPEYRIASGSDRRD